MFRAFEVDGAQPVNENREEIREGNSEVVAVLTEFFEDLNCELSALLYWITESLQNWLLKGR